jgi:hypothetical protein
MGGSVGKMSASVDSGLICVAMGGLFLRVLVASSGDSEAS